MTSGAASRRRDGRTRDSRGDCWRRRRGLVGSHVSAAPGSPAPTPLARRSRRTATADAGPTVTAARRLNRAAGTAGLSVLADSAMEHYRGSFHNRAMYTPLVVSALTLAASAHGVADHARRASRRATRSTSLAALTGLVGTGFHIYNIGKRPGGFCWQNLFYARADRRAGRRCLLSGLARLRGRARARHQPGGSRRSSACRPAGCSRPSPALGLLGTVGRGRAAAFPRRLPRPGMFAAGHACRRSRPLSLAETALAGAGATRWFTRWWLRLTARSGLPASASMPTASHRNMGGWRNWRQNVLNGPPLPAPPSFTGLALAGLAALGSAARTTRDA